MKKLKGLLVLALFLVVSMGSIKAHAAPSTVTSVTQKSGKANSVEIEWNALLDNDVRYEAAISTDGVNWVMKERYPYTSNSMEITGLNAGSVYKVRVRGYTREWNPAKSDYDRIYGNYSAPIEVVTSPNQAPRNVRHTGSSATSVTVQWDAVPGANGYVVEYANEKNTSASSFKTVRVNSTKATLNKLSKNAEYRIMVYPVKSSSTGFITKADWSTRSTVYNIPVVPSGLKSPEVEYYWAYSGQFRVESPNKRSADGYQYEVRTFSNSKVTTVTDTSSYSAFIKKNVLKKHRAFKVRVRGYITLNGGSRKICGAWSDYRYFAQQPDIISLKRVSKDGKIRAKWDTIDGASQYVLYGSTKEKSGYKKIATVKKTTYDISKVCGKKLKKNKAYYFKVVAQRKVGKKYVSLATGDATKVWYIKYK